MWTSGSIPYNFSNGYFVADYIISILVICAIAFFIIALNQRKSIIIIVISFVAAFILFLTLNLRLITLILLLTAVAALIIFATANLGTIRKYLANPREAISFKGSKVSKGTESFDRDKFIKNIVAAVNWLSNTKTGALITFEQKDPMDDYMKNGTTLDCVFTPELLETIFFEGTRLHDGAVIIRGNKIIAAAVFYPPYSKPVEGKVGARHRAAIGISELTDSVTIVVSEETGRISITSNGVLDHVKLPELERALKTKLN